MIIPKAVRDRHGWQPGVELEVEDRGDAVVLRLATHVSRRPRSRRFTAASSTTVRRSRSRRWTRRWSARHAGCGKSSSGSDGDRSRYQRRGALPRRATTRCKPDRAESPACETARRSCHNGAPGDRVGSPDQLPFRSRCDRRWHHEATGLARCRSRRPRNGRQALVWYGQGLDFADALHLASSARAEAFATFDRALRRKARAVAGTIPVVAP